ncbi:hypothetical protein [Actinomycetospora soli]|uniref:hypothetical protein n=1 Tax=Actinomycetospora soli TaxID=2893887 RepID=UPI001E48AF83|nr:hypothetical protein [Actinomycetospora soli]MCD2186932.1 hypothetical protein [Actinomycetospora soli]
MSDTQTTAVTALREAGEALRIGGRAEGLSGAVPDDGLPAVAGEVGRLLDALVDLLHQVDPAGVPTGSAEHGMHAVAQHLVAGATAAREVARPSTPGPPAGAT